MNIIGYVSCNPSDPFPNGDSAYVTKKKSPRALQIKQMNIRVVRYLLDSNMVNTEGVESKLSITWPNNSFSNSTYTGRDVGSLGR